YGVAREQRRAQHHRGGRGVGAGRDRGDHHRPMVQFELAVLGGGDLHRGGGAPLCTTSRGDDLRNRLGGGGRSVTGWEGLRAGLVDGGRVGGGRLHVVGQRFAERTLGTGQRDAVLRTLRSGDRRDHRG